MTIWIDICHTPQYNFYKQLILRAAGEGHRVLLTVLDRGRTPAIIRKELEGVRGVSIDVIGRHRMNRFSAIVEANFLRLISLWHWARKRPIDLVFSNCMAAMVIGRWLNIPRYSFDDDPQTMDFKPKKWCSLESNYCLYDDPATAAAGGSVHVLKCLKEWAYLCPEVFKPDTSALEVYGLQPKEYVFVREVTVGTVNYTGQTAGAVLAVKDFIPKNKKVLFSLEEKHRRNEYPSDWILLQEPVRDIHSLIYYSAGLVSSGDSMAREAAMLGVPAYYLGVRHSMPANRAAHKVAGLQNEQSMPFKEWVRLLDMSAAEAAERQQARRNAIDSGFIDINGYMWDICTRLSSS